MNMENGVFKIIDEYNLLNPGGKLPVFEWVDKDGNSLSSVSLHGKPLLVILFSTTCPHCRQNFSYLDKNLFSEVAASINIIGIGRDCSIQQADDYRESNGLPFHVIADSGRKIYSMFAEKAVPRMYFFNKEGRLMISIRGFKPQDIDKLREMI